MAKGAERDQAAIRVTPLPQAGAALRVHPALERYARAVRAEVDADLTPEEVDVRLRGTLEAHARDALPERGSRSESSGFDSCPDWAAYGLRIVGLWLSAVAGLAHHPSGLHRDSLEDLAVETVARAVNTFRDRVERPEDLPRPQAAGAETRTEFLAECVRHLPYAYRSRRLMSHDGLDDEFEYSGEPRLVELLLECATGVRGARLRLVGGLEEGEMDEVPELTRRAVESAARRHPGIPGPGLTP